MRETQSLHLFACLIRSISESVIIGPESRRSTGSRTIPRPHPTSFRVRVPQIAAANAILTSPLPFDNNLAHHGFLWLPILSCRRSRFIYFREDAVPHPPCPLHATHAANPVLPWQNSSKLLMLPLAPFHTRFHCCGCTRGMTSARGLVLLRERPQRTLRIATLGIICLRSLPPEFEERIHRLAFERRIYPAPLGRITA